MTDQNTIALLFKEICRLTDLLSPWVGADEMRARYDVTMQTLKDMERRGEIPVRTNGRWSRSELLQWEQRRAA